MGTAKGLPQYPDHFIDNGVTIETKEHIANLFNDVFVNVGPELAKNIMSPANISIYDYMGDRNERNIFISPVNEHEVIRVVRMCANKNSSDNDGITMKIVKHVITSIAKPFTYICNMSFTTGVFPDKMKSLR